MDRQPLQLSVPLVTIAPWEQTLLLQQMAAQVTPKISLIFVRDVLQKKCLKDIQLCLLFYFFLQGTFVQKVITVSKGPANQSHVEMEHT